MTVFLQAMQLNGTCPTRRRRRLTKLLLSTFYKPCNFMEPVQLDDDGGCEGVDEDPIVYPFARPGKSSVRHPKVNTFPPPTVRAK